MDADTPGIVEAVANKLEPLIDRRPLVDASPSHIRRLQALALAREVIPFILEEAAKVAEGERDFVCVTSAIDEAGGAYGARFLAERIAKAIRSLSKDGEGLDDH